MPEVIGVRTGSRPGHSCARTFSSRGSVSTAANASTGLERVEAPDRVWLQWPGRDRSCRWRPTDAGSRPRMRVAVTVEQFWHVVPGGIAPVPAELVRALTSRSDLEVTGISARHPDAPAEAFAATAPIRQLPLPRRVLYESWQWLRRPVVERATGPVDVVHDMGYVVPPSRAPLVATVHDLWFLDHPDHYTWH